MENFIFIKDGICDGAIHKVQAIPIASILSGILCIAFLIKP